MQQFKVGDHVIVDEGSSIWHDLETGIDGVVVAPQVGHPCTYPRVQSRSRALYGYDTQYVDPAALIKVDDLVTYPEFKVGDRAIVVSNTGYADGGCKHVLDVGTDVEIVGGPRASDRLLYDVRGVGARGFRYTQFVAACDLEPEPTYPRRSWWVDNTDATDDFEIIEFSLTPAATIALNETRRAAALSKAIEVLGADRDIDELTAAADWLLAS